MLDPPYDWLVPAPSGSSRHIEEGTDAGFAFKLELRDASPADPATLSAAPHGLTKEPTAILCPCWSLRTRTGKERAGTRRARPEDEP